MNKTCRVEFVKENITLYVTPGTTVAEAAERAGIILNFACAKAGTCGKCKVELSGAVSEPTGEEKELLGDVERAAGIRLSCQAKIMGTVSVHVFASQTFATAKIMEWGENREVKLAPCVRKYPLTLTPSTLEESLSDAAVIERALGRELVISSSMLRAIPTVLRASDWKVTVAIEECENRLIDIEAGDTARSNYAVAFDIGTTSVVGTLIDLTHGRDVATASRLNLQHKYGLDVISRIKHSLTAEGMENLHRSVVSTVNEIIDELAVKGAVSGALDRRHIYEISVAGNTTMTHLFLKVPVESLSHMPFTPAFVREQRTTARELSIVINPEGAVYSLPMVGGFVGADTTACILASGMHKAERTSIIVDIGTNGEVALGDHTRMLTSSAPAGPAFEGAEIKYGMRATTGAIEKVVIDNDVTINVIGNAAAAGICGSGLIDAVAELLNKGVITDTGEMLKPADVPASLSEKLKKRIVLDEKGAPMFLLSPKGGEPVYLTQKDVRELQLAKGAIRAIIDMLITEAGISLSDIETFYIAGAFGNYIRCESAVRIGLIPPLPREKVRFIGNAALTGSRMTLLCAPLRRDIAAFSREARNMEFAGRPEFQMAFSEAMLFPVK